MIEAPLRCRPLGDRALLVVLGDRIDLAVHRRVLALTEAIRAARLTGVTDLVPAYGTIGVWFDPEARASADLAEEVARLAGRSLEPEPREGREWVIPTRYDGPDLPEVAERTGLSVREVAARHTARTYRVYLIGFVPGFAFLAELDPALKLPRRAPPRTRVPAGSVAIAGVQTAVYPLETPGGWHLIGRTDVRFFDLARSPPTLLAVGDRVRFEAAT